MPADTDAGAGAPANPLLTEGHRVPFDTIVVEHYVPAVRSALDWAREELEGLKSTGGELNYDAVLGRFSRLVEWPLRVFGLVRHLNDTLNSPDSRAAYNEVLPEYTAFMSGLTTDQGLWRVVEGYAASRGAASLDPLREGDLRRYAEAVRRGGPGLPHAG